MEETLSRSEKKRRAKNVEDLAKELIQLSANTISALPCDVPLQQEIKSASKLKGPAKKRQLKYIARELRNIETEPIYSALEKKKGSQLKKKKAFHELEHLRDAIINAAIALHEDFAAQEKRPQESDLQDEIFAGVTRKFPEIDIQAVKISALRFASSRKIKYTREVFRILNAAAEQQKFAAQTEGS